MKAGDGRKITLIHVRYTTSVVSPSVAERLSNRAWPLEEHVERKDKDET